MSRIIPGLLLALLATLPLSGCVPVIAVGVGSAALMADDRRTTGTYLTDEQIELKAGNRLSEAKLDGVHASFTSYNRRLLITGQTPTEALKARVGEIAREQQPDIRAVINELAVAGPTGLTARSNDGFITAKVKARFIDDRRFSAHHVKVVTENGVVYLLGLVKREEGAAAAEVAARTSGVTRVVKVLEYQD